MVLTDESFLIILAALAFIGVLIESTIRPSHVRTENPLQVPRVGRDTDEASIPEYSGASAVRGEMYESRIEPSSTSGQEDGQEDGRTEVPSYGGAFALFGPVRDAPGSIFFADSGIIERTEGSLPDGSTLPSILIPLQSLQFLVRQYSTDTVLPEEGPDTAIQSTVGMSRRHTATPFPYRLSISVEYRWDNVTGLWLPTEAIEVRASEHI